MALEVGSRLGHYDVTAKIGEGSIGAVYRARDTRLDRDVALKVLLLLGLGICACCGDTTTADVTDVESVARRIHDRVITIDTHDDIPFNFATREVDPGIRANRQVDLPKMREGGLDVGFFIVYVGQGQNDPEGYAQAYEQAITKFEAIHRMANEMYPDQIEVAYTADDVERIYNDGKLVAAIGIENGWPVGESLANVATFHELGGRYITLAHNGHNQIADSANPRPDEPEELHRGISDFGAEVIAEMNRLGIMVDVSHISKSAMLEAIELSEAPVIASHSSCRALCDVPRNLDDEQLMALKANGGVIQVVALGRFVKLTPERDVAIDALVAEIAGVDGMRALLRRRYSASDEERTEMAQQLAAISERIELEIDLEHPPPDVEDFVDHIDYAVQLIGLDHVGVSSDFDGGGGVAGWNDASETFNITLELVNRGYSEAEIAQLWSGNTLRVWRQVEEVAQRLQAASD